MNSRKRILLIGGPESGKKVHYRTIFSQYDCCLEDNKPSFLNFLHLNLDGQEINPRDMILGNIYIDLLSISDSDCFLKADSVISKLTFEKVDTLVYLFDARFILNRKPFLELFTKVLDCIKVHSKHCNVVVIINKVDMCVDKIASAIKDTTFPVEIAKVVRSFSLKDDDNDIDSFYNKFDESKNVLYSSLRRYKYDNIFLTWSKVIQMMIYKETLKRLNKFCLRMGQYFGTESVAILDKATLLAISRVEFKDGAPYVETNRKELTHFGENISYTSIAGFLKRRQMGNKNTTSSNCNVTIGDSSGGLYLTRELSSQLLVLLIFYRNVSVSKEDPTLNIDPFAIGKQVEDKFIPKFKRMNISFS